MCVLSKGQVCTVLVLSLHEVLFWQLAYQQYAVQQLQDCPCSWVGQMQGPVGGKGQYYGQTQMHYTEAQSML